MTILHGDCIEKMSEFSAVGRTFDLVVADPPYNIGIDYGQGGGADLLPGEEYAAWCRKWIALAASLLSPNGSLWIISGQEFGAWIDIAIQQAGMAMRSRITWYETFGVNCTKKFNRTSRPIFYAVKNPKSFTFNREAVTVPSARQEKYGDARAAAGGKIMDDVWQIPRVCGSFKERIKGVPTQLPSELVRRIIECSTNVGDAILDPFCGSGTTLAVAKRYGRSGTGIELNADYIAIAETRVEEAAVA